MRIPIRSLTFWIFVGLFAGMIFGRLFGEAIVPIAEPMSDVFLRLLRMAIMPLIIASLIGIKTFMSAPLWGRHLKGWI